MLGGPAALLLASLALAGPCTGASCPIGVPADALDATGAGLDDASPRLPPPLPVDLDELPAPPDTSLDIELDPLAPALDALARAELPPDRPETRLLPPHQLHLVGPADTTGAVPAPTARPEPSTPSLAHAARAQAPTPSLTADPVDGEHAPRPAATRVTGAPIDGADPQRTALALIAGLAAIGLYHRLTKDRVLDHPTRQRILALLDEAPGQTTGELADTLDVSYRTARHHAEMLAAFDLAISLDQDGAERWCLPGDAQDLPAPLDETGRRVLELLDQEEGVHLSEIARRLEMAKATTKYQLDRLTEQGWVEDERVGPLRRFTATPTGRDRLDAETG